jgi:hypothetical protein
MDMEVPYRTSSHNTLYLSCSSCNTPISFSKVLKVALLFYAVLSVCLSAAASKPCPSCLTPSIGFYLKDLDSQRVFSDDLLALARRKTAI